MNAHKDVRYVITKGKGHPAMALLPPRVELIPSTPMVRLTIPAIEAHLIRHLLARTCGVFGYALYTELAAACDDIATAEGNYAAIHKLVRETSREAPFRADSFLTAITKPETSA